MTKSPGTACRAGAWAGTGSGEKRSDMVTEREVKGTPGLSSCHHVRRGHLRVMVSLRYPEKSQGGQRGQDDWGGQDRLPRQAPTCPLMAQLRAAD